MKGTEEFKKTILEYLEDRAGKDELFAISYAKPGKNIDDCIIFILETVQKSECNGFADSEIFSLAVNYYDEDDIRIGEPMNCSVTVNHHVELTEEEKQEAKAKAIARAEMEAYNALQRKRERANEKQKNNNAGNTQLSLF